MRDRVQLMVALVCMLIAVYLLFVKEQYLWGVIALVIMVIALRFREVLRIALGPEGLKAEFKSPDLAIDAKKQVAEEIEQLASEIANARLARTEEVTRQVIRDSIEAGVAIGVYSQMLRNLLRLPLPSVQLLHNIVTNIDESGFTELEISSEMEREHLEYRLQILRFAGIVGDWAHSERGYNIGVRLSDQALTSRDDLMRDTEGRLEVERVLANSSAAG